MPDKPAAQLVREYTIELKETVSSLRAGVDYSEKNIARLEASNTKTADALKETEKKLAAVEERVNEAKRVLDEIGRRRFTLLQAVLCVVLGGVLTFLFQLAFTYLKSRFGAGP